jgi:hypothetical protein
MKDSKSVAVGTRWTLKFDVCRYPSFLAAAGMIGTVIEADEGLVRLKMDEHLDGAEAWDNCIEWVREDDEYIDDDLNGGDRVRDWDTCDARHAFLADANRVEA